MTAATYSPVAEAENCLTQERLAAAARLLAAPEWGGIAAAINRVPAEAVARHLGGALEVLTERGWTQSAMRSPSGGVCLLQALTDAAELGYGQHPEESGTFYENTTHYVAGRYLDLMISARTRRLEWYLDWNDAPGRTFDEVRALVADAIAFARTRA